MDQDIDIRQFVGLVRRQIWLILAVVFVVMVAATAVVFTLTPKYTATATVMVDPSSKNLLTPDDRSTASSVEINARVDSEVGILNADNAITQVIKDENLISDPEFGVSLGLKDKLMAALNLGGNETPNGDQLLAKVLQKVKRAVSVDREGLTYLISVSFTSRDPQKAAKLANDLVQTYIDQQVASKVSTTVASRNIIQAQIGQANAAIVAGEKRFDDYMETNLPQFEAQSGSADIKRLREQLESIKKDSDARTQALNAATEQLTSGNYSALADTLKDDAVKELQNQRAALAASLSTMDSKNKNAVNLRAELDKIDANLKAKASEAVDSLKKEVSTSATQATDVRQQLRSSIMSSNLPPEVLTDLYSLQKESEIARNQYQSLLSRMKELDTQAQIEVADSRVVNQALVPPDPSFPKTGLTLAVSFLASLVLGVGFGFLRENFIGGFVSEEQVENVLRVPLASVIRKQSTTATIQNGMPDIIVTSPMSVFAESIRKIRVKVEQMIFKRAKPDNSEDGNDCMIILVTSSVPNEGKSTVSLSLARTLAHSGKRTLLIDADLRKPSLHKLLGLEPSTELSSFLQGSAVPQSISPLTASDPMSSLKVALGGRSSTYATDELVMGDRFSRLIATAKRHFDYIVIDTPPIEPVVDGLYLARHADIVTFVVRWGSTSQTVAKRSVAALQENCRPGTTIMAVMNQKEEDKARSYYRYSGYYHE